MFNWISARIFAKGADGGRGLYKHGGGIGALVRAVFFFQEGDTIFISVGQAGSDACSPTTKVHLLLFFYICQHYHIVILIFIISVLQGF